MSLNDAPDHIKLAVDLIALLEENQIKDETAIAALKIVLHDFERKQATATCENASPSE